MPLDRIPAYTRHKASGQAVVRVDGHDIYLGVWRSARSRSEYDRVITEWLAAGRRLPSNPDTITVLEVVNAFRKHARSYYRDADGTLGKAATNIFESLKPVLRLYGKTPASEFGPLRLKAVRETMIASGRARSNINRHVVRIRGVFKWAAENELIPAGVFHGLMSLSGLRAGRSGARESEPVKPVPIEYVEAVLPHVSRHMSAMIRLQLLTGARPGEICIMRTCDIDTTGGLWKYKPRHHKSQHRGHTRDIFLGPKAQEIIRPFLKLDTSAYCFDPREAEQERRAKLREARTTPPSCGNRTGTNRKRHPKRTPGDHYTVTAYYVAIQRGCDKADSRAKGGVVIANDERLVPRWHPHQLRHSRATELRDRFGIEAVQAVLGHRQLRATEIYAEKNSEAAKRVMAEVG